MGNRTDRFGFTTFDNEKDDLAAGNYKAFGADQINLDRLLRVATETHRHDGSVYSQTVPAPPALDIDLVGGSLPPNTSIYYRVALVDPFGQEQLASQTASLVTPVQSPTPTAPQLETFSTGILPPGDYQYAVSAYVGDTLHETPMSPTTSGTLTPMQWGFRITFPRLPSGATGFNVYRKGPTESGFNFLLNAEGIPYVYDDGSIERSRARTSPTTNTTTTTTVVIVNGPIPQGGWTCKIYRTFDSSDWNRTLIGWVPELPFIDVGAQPEAGYPPDSGAGVGGAPKISLEDETAGFLPSGLVPAKVTVLFNMPGTLETGTSHWQWINDFDLFTPLTARAHLGVGSVPAELPVLVAVEYRYAGTTDWLRYTQPGSGQTLMPEIPVGQRLSSQHFVAWYTDPPLVFRPGDAFRAVVLQTGGGDPATDENLTVTLAGIARHGSATKTPVWGAP